MYRNISDIKSSCRLKYKKYFWVPKHDNFPVRISLTFAIFVDFGVSIRPAWFLGRPGWYCFNIPNKSITNVTVGAFLKTHPCNFHFRTSVLSSPHSTSLSDPSLLVSRHSRWSLSSSSSSLNRATAQRAAVAVVMAARWAISRWPPANGLAIYSWIADMSSCKHCCPVTDHLFSTLLLNLTQLHYTYLIRLITIGHWLKSFQ